MSLDLVMFADKLKRYYRQLEVSEVELAKSTGIPVERILKMLKRDVEPTGDEILILADFFKCDYNFFISNEKLAAFEQTEALFRTHSKELNVRDRWAIQEFLFLCECEEFLLQNLPNKRKSLFTVQKRGVFCKGHGYAAALQLRQYLGYQPNEIPRDVFSDFQRIGIHVFRRKLEQGSISGLFVRHPVAGPCILINYSEDVFRQRFTGAHEAAHALLDDGKDFVVSHVKLSREDRSEVRANAFASHFLLPPDSLRLIPDASIWDTNKALKFASALMVNTETLAIALKEAGIVGDAEAAIIRSVKVPREMKMDPELSASLPPKIRERKIDLLERGLSSLYVEMCFNAYEQGIITAARVAEMLIADIGELPQIAGMYSRKVFV